MKRAVMPREAGQDDMDASLPAETGDALAGNAASGATTNRFGMAVIFAFFTIAMAAAFLSFSHDQGIRRFIGATDFRPFYTAGQMLLHGVRADLYDVSLQFAWQARLMPEVSTQAQTLPFLNPPFIALLMSVIALLSLETAYIVWAVLNLILVAVVCALLLSALREMGQRAQTYILVVILTFLPLWIDVMQGQLSLLLVLAFLGSWYCFKASKERRGGLWLALLLIKPYYLVVPVLLLLFTRRVQALVGLAAGSAALFIVSVITVGWQGILSYGRLLVSASGWGDQYGIHPRFAQTWRGFLLFLAQTDDASTVLIPWLISIALVVALILYTWRGGWRPAMPVFDLQWASVVVACLFISPHANIHDLILFLVACVLMLRYWRTTTRAGRSEALLIVLALLGYLAGWAAIANPLGLQQTIAVFFESLSIVTIALMARRHLEHAAGRRAQDKPA